MSETAEDAVRCERCGAEFVDGDACPLCGALRAPVPCDDEPGKPAHSRCVICARALCDGREPTGPALCAEHRSVPVIEGWSQVYTTAVELEAQLIVENLLAEGIDAQLYSQRDRSFPVDLGELSIARVLVPVWEHQQALEIIQERMDTEGEVLFACPSCGEAYEPGARECASCGAPLAA